MVWALVVSSVVGYFNWPAIPSRVHTLLGSSLGLLLVFRTNTSYGRYWEGRGLWEKLHSKTRVRRRKEEESIHQPPAFFDYPIHPPTHPPPQDIARMVSIYEDCIGTEKVRKKKQTPYPTHSSPPTHPPTHLPMQVTAVARLICAYPLALREHLTGETHKADLSRLLGPQLSDTMDCAVNKPLWLCNRLSLLFRGVPESKNFSSRYVLSPSFSHFLSRRFHLCCHMLQKLHSLFITHLSVPTQ